MFSSLLWLILGMLAVWYGADWLVRSAARIANAFDVPPLVIGLTVVAFGTSVPELATCIVAVQTGATDLALGNVIGSNVANIGLILGLSALVRPIPVSLKAMRWEVPAMIGATAAIYGFAWNGGYGRFEGIILTTGLVVLTCVSLRGSRKEAPVVTEEFEQLDLEQSLIDPLRVWKDGGLLLAGLVLLAMGAELLVDSGVDLAQRFGVSELVIAMSMIAVGTSLPELATSIAAVRHGAADVMVGNIVGSNLFNILAALGISAIVNDIPVDPAVMNFEFLVLLLFTAAMAWVVRSERHVTRIEGVVLFGAYVSYMILLFQRISPV